jgi:tetratricopeptide (TPR) repeat protein
MSENPSTPSLSETGENTEIVSAEALEALKALQAADGMLSQLRAEVAVTTDKGRQARLHAEIGELEERAGDEPGAARDYLAAFNADPTFREPLEGLVRLLERRRSLKNLGRLLEALVRAAVTADEKTRALTMHAAFLEDVSEDLEGSKAALRDATSKHEGVGAAEIETKSAWLALELVAGKTQDATLRSEALGERANAAGDPTWQALLLIDFARVTAADGDLAKAFDLLDEAKRKGGGATYLAVHATSELAAKDTEDDTRKAALLGALESEAEMIALSMTDGARGDQLGVPHDLRSTSALIDILIRVSNFHRASGDMNGAGAALERAQKAAQNEGTPPLLVSLVLQARMRVAEVLGDTARASQLAEILLQNEKDGGVAASLAMRVAEQAANEGDVAAALAALSSAVQKDPACLPARALQLDLLADGGDPALFAVQLEAFAATLPTDEARGRAALLSAFVRAQANDATAAKSSLNEAKSRGVEPELLWRVGRMLARLLDDANWYEETTRRLIQALTTKDETPGPNSERTTDGELARLWFEIVRAKLLRGDIEGAQVALAELADVHGGAWLGNALEAFLPDFVGAAPTEDGSASEGTSAFEKLADLEQDPATARGLALVAAIDAQRRGATDRARSRLRALADQDPSDPVVAAFLADLARASGDAAAAAAVLETCAEATDDAVLSGSLHIEAALSFWSSGDRRAALASFERAAERDGAAAKMAYAWTARGVDPDQIDSRRRAFEAAEEANEETSRIALERFAAEIGSDSTRAYDALITAETDGQGDLAIAASLARLIWAGSDPEKDEAAIAAGRTWPAGTDDAERVATALAHLAAAGVDANRLAAAEQLRRARFVAPERAVEASQAWFDAGGGVVAALEWVSSAMAAKAIEDEAEARRELSTCFEGQAAEAISASAAVLLAARTSGVSPELVRGKSEAVRLANLELAPPGSDPRKRATVLRALGGVLGDEAELDALTLAAWSMLTAGDAQTAKDLFTRTSTVRPNDISLWEGLRSAAEILGDHESRARAASELGARCKNPERGAMFWEEAAQLYSELGQESAAETAYDKSFTRDPTRAVAFDKLFRKVRERKDGERLLGMIARRLDVADDPGEISKLFWEQARVLRERGDSDGALRALENVTMIEPEHVGALALTGEIFIRRGMFEEAATNLSKLATLADAPPKNRVTAGIAAVDLYENKLDRFDKALEVLLSLHRAELSTLPVRERLARAAARTGSWIEATAILEQLMEERPEAQGRIEAARLAMAIHRDRLNNPANAALAVVRLLEESPADGEGIDILLELKGVDDRTKKRLFVKSEEALLAAIQKAPDAAQIRRLARVVRITGNEELEHIALSVGAALGMNDVAGDALLAQYTLKKPRTPQIAFTPATLGKLMAPGDDAPIANLFAVLGPTLSEALGPAIAALGVTKKERVDAKSGLQVRNEIGAWTGAFGIPEFELYVGGRDANGAQGIPGEPAALVIGTTVNAPLSTAARARVARELCGIVRGTTVLRSRDDTTIAAIVVSACKLAEVPISSPTYAVQAEVDKLLSKAISRRTKKMLPDICRAVVASQQDARAWAASAILSQARAALVASGDATATLSDLLGETPEHLRETLRDRLRTDDRAANLVRFALSPSYLELRRALGLEGLS